MPIIAIALIFSAMLGAGMSVVASKASVGEPMYWFKVHVNEAVEAALERGGATQSAVSVDADAKP